MQNSEIGRVLSEIADMLEIRGENFFRVRAYRNAARAVWDYPANFAELSIEKMAQVAGIGKDLSAKIETLVSTGELALHRELSAQVPAGVLALMHPPGLGPKRVKQISSELGIQDLAQLKVAAESGALRSIRGLGPKMEEKLLEHLNREPRTRLKRWPYADAAIEVDAILKYLRRCKAVERAEAAGSFRRRRDTVGDLDILAIAASPSEVTKWVLDYPRAAKTLGSGDTKTTIVLHDGLQVDVRILPAASYGAAMIYFTGSQAHCIHIRKIAQKMRLSLNEYGLMQAGKSIAGSTEEEVYEKLRMAWIPPELREDRGEVEAALENRLPRLIERADLRGDLHTHSTPMGARRSRRWRELRRRRASSISR